jgi:hypothetical protein
LLFFGSEIVCDECTTAGLDGLQIATQARINRGDNAKCPGGTVAERNCNRCSIVSDKNFRRPGRCGTDFDRREPLRVIGKA